MSFVGTVVFTNTKQEHFPMTTAAYSDDSLGLRLYDSDGGIIEKL
jgi:hypothetical protein